MRRFVLTSLVVLLAALAAPIDVANADGPGCGFISAKAGSCGARQTATLRPSGHPEAARRVRPVTSGPRTQFTYAPTCGGNTSNQANVQCPGALTICDFTPGAPMNAIALWVWSRPYDPAKLPADQAPFAKEPGYTCLAADAAAAAGAAAPQLPTAAQAAAVVQRDFQSFVVLQGTTVVNPPTTTLINVETIFSTDRAEPVQLPPLTILTHAVTITIKPESYTWYFGDGSTLTTSNPGRPGEKDVTHVYRTPTARLLTHVVISWSGTFTVDGGESLPVRGVAQTTGPDTPLKIASAHSELVSQLSAVRDGPYQGADRRIRPSAAP